MSLNEKNIAYFRILGKGTIIELKHTQSHEYSVNPHRPIEQI